MAEGNQLMKPEDRLAAQAGVPQTANMRGLSMSQIRDVGTVMAASGMFPDIAKDGAKAFVKILAGQEMGIAPFEAMGGISIIQGKATVGGNIMASKVKGSGKYDYKIRARTNTGCTIEFFEKIADDKWESIGTEVFDQTDATAAGLAGKEMWKKYPKNMYFNRCISNGVRTYCPDVLGAGPVYTPEEMGAQVDDEGNVVVAPGITYTQNTASAAALPESTPISTEEPAPTEAPHIRREGNPLQLISDDLLDKGFENKGDRGLIALRFPGVAGFDQLTRDEWFEVYDKIVDTNAADLETLLTPTEEETAVTDEEPVKNDQPEDEAITDAVVDVFGEDIEKIADGKPKTTTKESPKPLPSQIAKLALLYKKNNIVTDKEKQDFNTKVIAKNHGITKDDYAQLIAAAEKL
jgi:hypothetical protein